MMTGLAVTGASVAGLALDGRAGFHDRAAGLVVGDVVVLPFGSVWEITRPRWSRTTLVVRLPPGMSIVCDSCWPSAL